MTRPLIRVFIAADVRLYREGLGVLLGETVGIRIVGTAAQCSDVLQGLESLAPDLLLLDMTMTGSVPTIRAIAETAPHVKVVAIGVAEVEHQILTCAEAGVSGYVPRDASVEDLVACIESAMRGEALCSPRAAATLLRRVAALSAAQDTPPAGVRLTSREHEIVELIDRGLSNKGIARELKIEVATVKNHVHNLLEKLRVHRRGEAARCVRALRSAHLSPLSAHETNE